MRMICFLTLMGTIAPAVVEGGETAPAVTLRTVTLRATVVDAATGQPLPGRVYVRSAPISGKGGRWFFARSASPEGSAVEYRKERQRGSVEMHTTVSAHPFVVEVPVSPRTLGRYTVSVERGKEYLPVEKEVEVGQKGVTIKFELRRWIDMAAAGWYSGDTHVHRSIEELPNVMLAEDINVGLPLPYWVTTAYTPPGSGDKTTVPGSGNKTTVPGSGNKTTVPGSGNKSTAAPASPAAGGTVRPEVITIDPTHVIYPVNTEYEIFSVGPKRHTLGAVFVLGHKTPFATGVPPVGPIAEEARRQGALLDLDKHSWPWSLMLVPVMKVDLFELANNHCWRTEFGFRQWSANTAPAYMKLQRDQRGFTEWGWIDFGFQSYYALLNCGFRMRPTAGTASGVHPVPLGFGRVYVHLPGGFSYEKWMQGLNAGRSFVTTGPMLMIEVDGRPPGATIRAQGDGRRTCRITGTTIAARPLRPMEIVVNGRIVRRVALANRKTPQGGYESPIDARVELEGSSWIAIRVFEERPDRRIRFAHSSPVHVDIPGKPLRPRREEVDYLIRRMKEEIERNRDVLRPEGLEEYHHALQVYQEIAKEAR